MNKRTIITTLIAILLIGWMTLIFSFSCEDGIKSGKTSTNVLTGISEIVAPSKPPKETEKLIENNQKIIRKIAHMTNFFIFSFINMMLFYFASNRSVCKTISVVLLISFFGGCFDEITQLFVEGRSGNFLDVLIDFSGSLCACMFFLMLMRKSLFRNKKVIV